VSPVPAVLVLALTLFLLTPAPAAPAAPAAGAAGADALPTRDGVCQRPRGPQVSVRPGLNEILPVSRGHLNRLLTPFPTPQATTVNDTATVQVKGAAVYVALSDDTPVALYLTDPRSEAVAISLTLVPCLLPPQEITLAFADGVRLPVVAPPAGEPPPPLPYLTTLTGLLRDLALGRTPAGFTLRPFQPGDPAPACAWPDLQIRPGQILESPDWIITVAAAHNVGGWPVDLEETACAGPDVAAVAAWPAPPLAPAQAVEVYLVTRRPPSVAPAGAPRPSLLTGGR